MTETLKIGISGVRGIIGESLSPDLVLDFAQAFGVFINSGRVVIGTDTRSSRGMLKYAAVSGLLSSGCTVIDLGIATTPTIMLMTKEIGAEGGMIITASHNPSAWNGLKFVRNDGIFLNEKQANELIAIYQKKKFRAMAWEGVKDIKTNLSANNLHVTRVLSHVDVEKIRKRKLKVAVDSCNGAGYLITPKLLHELGVEAVFINNDPNLPFAHNPEPKPDNLEELCRVVKEKGADIGFAQDPDGDRLALVAEDGSAIPEDYTLALVAEYILSTFSTRLTSHPYTKMVVTNLSTSRMIEDVAERYGAQIVRTRIGEVNVSEYMKDNNAVIGGEGNGGIIYPEVVLGRDSLSGIALILEYLADSGKKISQLVRQIPKYSMVKKKIAYETLESAKAAVEDLKKAHRKEEVDLTEGLKISFKKSWMHIRISNTEPIIRVVAEAGTHFEANQLCDKFLKETEGILGKLAATRR
jgi:phosphomannomutase